MGTNLQLSNADTEVRFIEAVWYIPTQRTKLTPLLYQSVEEA